MPWNKPGGNKDPWSDKGSKKPGSSDLDNLLKKITGGGAGASLGTGMPGFIKFLPLILLVLWLMSGLFIVDTGKRGLVLRFGEFQTVKEAGWGWHLPKPIEQLEIVDVDKIESYDYETTMLTKDENIVSIKLAAQYRIKDAEFYQFNVRNPDFSLQQAVESALRDVVGNNEMDFVLKDGREIIAETTKTLTQEILDSYSAGILITTVNLSDSQPPDEVQGAFEDVIKAREDKERYIEEAKAYSNRVIPEARGQAARILSEANAFKDQVTAKATGDASRFEQLMLEYQKAPDVTRERLYLETIEEVYENTGKVLMDSKSGNSLMYLPLDKLMAGQNAPGQPALGNPTQMAAPANSSAAVRDTTRARGVR